MKQGNFSALSARIYNPLASPRTQFANNAIPANQINPVSANALNLFPDPNLPGIANNYVYNPVSTFNDDNFDFRVDQNFSSRDQAFFRFSHHYTDQYTPGTLPLPAVGSSNASNNTYPLIQFVAGYTRTFTPSLINEVRIGATRLDTHAYPLNYGNYIDNQVGIPGVNIQGNLLTSGLTQLNLTGYPTLGDSGFRPAIIANNNYQVNDSVTWIKGSHTVKLGGQMLRRQENMLQLNNLHGILNFGPIYSTNLTSPSGTGSSLADLLLGAPSDGNIAYVNGTTGYRRTDYGAFIQDTWKVTASLTLNLGLRYDAFPGYPWVEVDNRMAYFRPDLALSPPSAPRKNRGVAARKATSTMSVRVSVWPTA